MDFTNKEEHYANCLASDCPICDEDLNTGYKFGYNVGKRKGIIIGVFVTLPIIVIAHIISQGIMYWK